LSLKLAEGRLFTEEENKKHARVCIVAHELAKELWDGRAVGEWINFHGERCRIIGQLAKVDHWDTNFGFAWLDFVAMPFETAAETRPEILNEAFIQIRTDHVSSNDIVKRIANALMVDRHHGVDDFQIWDFNAFMKQFYMIFAIMESIVGLIAGIALIVGGIGVMNMMLVSVSERTREIGIRKAIGASPSAIAAQFLWEAAMLSGIGGATGTILGAAAAVGSSVAIRQMKEMWIGEVSVIAVIVALAASLLIGISFGYFPARSAGRLDPVAAIRR
jgi:putative ABC transport system permease protein